MYDDQASFQNFRTYGYVVINNFLSGSELKVLRQVQILVKQLCKEQLGTTLQQFSQITTCVAFCTGVRYSGEACI